MDFDDLKWNQSPSCSICLDLVLDRGDRSIAKLQCGHEFHLDCIGSAFNSKGAMQCPNCRKVEKGRWLYANGHHSSADLDLDAWVAEDIYDLNYSELPFLQWCPLRGITQLASLLEEGESQLSSYHETYGNSTFGDNLNAASSTHRCPYLAIPHAIMHSTPSLSSAAANSVSENSSTFSHNHLTNLGLGGGQLSADIIMPNSHSIEPQNHNSLPFHLVVTAADHHQSASQFGPRVSSRNDGSTQQFVRSHSQSHSLVGSGPHSASNLVTSLSPTPVHSHARGGHPSNHHIYRQHSSPSSSHRTSPMPPPPPIRRLRPPRAFIRTSSSFPTSSSAEVDGFYGYAASVSGSTNRSPQVTENMARHYDHGYGWGGSREGSTSLPWIPLEGESQWWSPFNPNQPPQSGGSFLQIQRPNAAERVSQSRPEIGGHQRMPLPPRMPPYM